MNPDRSSVFVSKIPHHASANHPDFVNDLEKRVKAIIQKYHDTALMEQARKDQNRLEVLTRTTSVDGTRFKVYYKSYQDIAYYDYADQRGYTAKYRTMLSLVAESLVKSAYRRSVTNSYCFIGENYLVVMTGRVLTDRRFVSDYYSSAATSIFNRKNGFAELFANSPAIIEICLSFHLILDRIIPPKRIPLGRPFRSRHLPVFAADAVSTGDRRWPAIAADAVCVHRPALAAIAADAKSANAASDSLQAPPKVYNNIRVEESCAICFEAASTVVYTPCGHCVVCTACDRAGEIRNCPVCRTGINDRVLFVREGVKCGKESVACSAAPDGIAN